MLWNWLVVLGSGAFGGLLHVLYQNDGKLELPKKRREADGTPKLDLGFFADLLLGVGAALVATLMSQQGILLTVSTGDKTVSVEGALLCLLAGWSGGAFLAKQALATEKAKVEVLTKTHPATNAPGGRAAVKRMVQAKSVREVVFLADEVLGAAAASDMNAGNDNK